MASIDEFVKAPTRAQLQDFTKDQLLDVARHYKINVSKSSQRTKESIISALDDGLVALEILSLEAGKEVKTVESGLSFAEQKELLELRLESQKLALEQEKVKLETLRLERAGNGVEAGQVPRLPFDIRANQKLIPQFDESDVETFFTLFDYFANSRNWADADRVLLLQSSLKGKALKAYTALRVNNPSLTSAQVKEAVLRAYEQTPETYREQFRAGRKKDGQTHLEFTRDLSELFTRWCASLKIESMAKVCDLMVVDQLRSSVSERLSSYLGDRGVTDPLEAAALADDYFINHKDEMESLKDAEPENAGRSGRISGQGGKPGPDSSCNYCKRRGHWKAECPSLKGTD